MTTPQASKEIVDVRTILPRERHPLIFSTFDGLLLGEALLLINDHDTKPLFYHFQAESAGEFTWEYIQKGPEIWQVRIGKVEANVTRLVSKVCSH